MRTFFEERMSQYMIELEERYQSEEMLKDLANELLDETDLRERVWEHSDDRREAIWELTNKAVRSNCLHEAQADYLRELIDEQVSGEILVDIEITGEICNVELRS